jgi:hypothetical protein
MEVIRGRERDCRQIASTSLTFGLWHYSVEARKQPIPPFIEHMRGPEIPTRWLSSYVHVLPNNVTSGCTALKFYSRDGLRLAYDITLLLYSLRVIVHGSMATLVVGGKRGPLIRFLEFAYQSWDRGIDPAATSVTSLVLKEYDLLDFWLAGEEGKKQGGTQEGGSASSAGP